MAVVQRSISNTASSFSTQGCYIFFHTMTIYICGWSYETLMTNRMVMTMMIGVSFIEMVPVWGGGQLYTALLLKPVWEEVSSCKNRKRTSGEQDLACPLWTPKLWRWCCNVQFRYWLHALFIAIKVWMEVAAHPDFWQFAWIYCCLSGQLSFA